MSIAGRSELLYIRDADLSLRPPFFCPFLCGAKVFLTPSHVPMPPFVVHALCIHPFSLSIDAQTTNLSSEEYIILVFRGKV
jgi:hypothetical protein